MAVSNTELEKKAEPATSTLSVVHGASLADEPGQDALTIPGYLREVTQRYGDGEALVMYLPDGSLQRWSYRDLWDRSVQVARALIACGVGKDSRVGILMTNRPEYLAALFGTAMAGGVSVALSTFSTLTEMEHLLSASATSVLLYEDKVLAKDFSAILSQLEASILEHKPGELLSETFPYLRRLVRVDSVTSNLPPSREHSGGAIEEWDAFLSRGEGVSPEVVEARIASTKPSDPGGLFFSSGTTSLPKGILHAHQAFTIQWWRWPRVFCLHEPVRSWTGNGFFWSGNISMMVGTALSTGGAMVLQPLFEAETALELMEKERVSLLLGRPHQWARLQSAEGWSSADLSALRYITRSELLLAHPTVKTDWQLPMSFGTSETMTINTSFTSDTPLEHYAGSFGVPLPGNVLKIIDPHTGEVVPRGERGEICIKGPTLMLGYIGKSLEETFDDEGYFRTGDGGYVDDAGRLYWEGRLTDIIKTGGANVSPEEVDAVISTHPGVKRTQTVGVPHETLNEMVVTCVVPRDGVDLDPDDVIRCAKEQLASFKLPRHVLLFAEKDFALTGNEKAKTGELRDLAVKRLGAEH